MLVVNVASVSSGYAGGSVSSGSSADSASTPTGRRFADISSKADGDASIADTVDPYFVLRILGGINVCRR